MTQTFQSLHSIKKGQIHSLDLMISLSIFMMLILITYFAWQRQLDLTSSDLLKFQAQTAAQNAINSIAFSPGFPTNWAAQNISPTSSALLGMGASDSYAKIDDFKLSILSSYYNNSIFYENTTKKMGIAPFNADIRILYLNSTPISTLGNAPSASTIVLYSKSQIASYKNNSAIIRVRIWQ
ncbi:MAG: hypothetical protein WC492_03970 [Candidatus Micrarchaeia archaeon]